MFRRQSLVFEELQFALRKPDQPAQEITDDHILILNKIKLAITSGNPFQSNGTDTTKDDSDSLDDSSEFE